MKKVFALIDCNSFYASCERIFNQKLETRPVIVLSNNDGCVIARTKEAKALGIKMGQPYFKIKRLAKQNNVFVASTNFTLYGDISNRVMETIKYFLDEVEVYSIDEAFVDLTSIVKSNLEEFGHEMKETIQKWTGVPVSVGIGATKTLAKAANEIAKQNENLNGVLDLYSDKAKIDKALSGIDISDVWGIGRQHTKHFYGRGIRNALQLKNVDSSWLKNSFNITVNRTVMELRGTACMSLEQTRADKKSIVCSRTFKSPTSLLNTLNSLITSYVSRAAEKLRSQDSETKGLIIFIETSRYNKDKRYSNSINIKLPKPTSSTLELIEFALVGLEKIYESGFEYKRAGVMFYDLSDANVKQLDLFYDAGTMVKRAKLMKSIDEINSKWGQGVIKSASENFNGLKFMRQNHISSKFTSQWNELPIVKA